MWKNYCVASFVLFFNIYQDCNLDSVVELYKNIRFITKFSVYVTIKSHKQIFERFSLGQYKV